MATKHGKAGRPSNDYVSSTQGKIVGLTRLASGQWRVQATGHRFREADEGLAIERFRKLTGTDKITIAHIPFSSTDSQQAARSELQLAGGRFVPEADMLAWFKAELQRDPIRIANAMGVPELAHYRRWTGASEASAKLSRLWPVYEKRTGSTKPKTVAKVKTAWERFVKLVDVDTCDEVTNAKLLAYADVINTDAKFGDKTRALIFSRVKAVVNTAAKFGEQVGTLSARMKVVAARTTQTDTNATPMKREVFRRLLDGADDRMRLLLLLALNCCMYGAEVCELKWADINMDAGTLVTRRGKTSIIRAAVLWPETLVELSKARAKLPTAQYVLTSQRGTMYNVESCRKWFNEHRERLEIKPSPFTELAAIRDAAYTTSSRSVLLQQTLVLAGHKVGGLSDKYIARNPEYVSDACEAVRLAYLG